MATKKSKGKKIKLISAEDAIRIMEMIIDNRETDVKTEIKKCKAVKIS